MKKNILFLLIIAFLASCSSKKTEPAFALAEEQSDEQTDFYSLKVAKPVLVADGENNQSAKIFNHVVDTFYASHLYDFSEAQLDSLKAMVQLSESGAKAEKLIEYLVTFRNKKIVSIRFTDYEFMLGAHGFTQLASFNYDFTGARFLKINDVLDFSDSVKISAINDLVRAHFENPDSCYDQQPEVNKDFERFNFTDKGILFSWEAYELGAYACGSPEILVPYAAFEEAGLLLFDPKSEK